MARTSIGTDFGKLGRGDSCETRRCAQAVFAYLCGERSMENNLAETPRILANVKQFFYSGKVLPR